MLFDRLSRPRDWMGERWIYSSHGIPKEKVLEQRKMGEIQVYNKVQTEISKLLRNIRYLNQCYYSPSLENIWISSLTRFMMKPVNWKTGNGRYQYTSGKNATTDRTISERERSIYQRNSPSCKNNLQIIISLLNLQSGYIKTGSR